MLDTARRHTGPTDDPPPSSLTPCTAWSLLPIPSPPCAPPAAYDTAAPMTPASAAVRGGLLRRAPVPVSDRAPPCHCRCFASIQRNIPLQLTLRKKSATPCAVTLVMPVRVVLLTVVSHRHAHATPNTMHARMVRRHTVFRCFCARCSTCVQEIRYSHDIWAHVQHMT